MAFYTCPLEIEIMIHYNCISTDFNDGDFSAPAICEALTKLTGHGLLQEWVNGDVQYRITDRGRAYVHVLTQVPFPTQITTWIIDDCSFEF